MLKNARTCKREIDLSGSDGNLFVLLGHATRLARQWALDEKVVINEMTASDYRNAVETFDRYFGDIVDLILPDGWEGAHG